MTQTEMNFSDMENAKTPFKNVRIPRPKWSDPEVLIPCTKDLVMAFEDKCVWEKYDDEDWKKESESLLSHLKFNTLDSDIEVYRFLKNEWRIDDETLFEEKENIESISYNCLHNYRNAVKNWIRFNGIIPPCKVGDKVTYRDDEEAIVTSVDESLGIIIVYSKHCRYKMSIEEAMERKAGTKLVYEDIFDAEFKILDRYGN